MASNSRFARHAALWLLLPVVLVFAVPAFPELRWFELSGEELAANRELLGVEGHDEVLRRTQSAFRRWSVESGAIAWSFRAFAPRDNVQAFEVLRDSRAAAGYLRRLWATVYKAFYRAQVAMRWLAALGIFFAACMVDGIVRHRVKRFEFGSANPVAFHLSGHGLLALAGLLLSTPFLPFPIQQWTWPVLIVAAGLLAWKVAESYQSSL